MIYGVTFILAYCSMVYELVMAQSLSAFLGDTIFRYSTTVGLYLASLGIGAFMCKERALKEAAYSLVKIEIMLSMLGGFCIVYLYLFHTLISSGRPFFLFSHALIIAIGILSGFEIPLLLEIKRSQRGGAMNPVLGVNYFGALTGAVIFPIFLLPSIGILLTAFLAGLLNAVGGLLLLFMEPRKKPVPCYMLNFILLAALVVCIIISHPMESFFIARYLSP